MEQIKQVMKQMINISEDELNDFLNQTITRNFKRQEILSRPNAIPNEIFFINKGLIRVLITDNEGTENTLHLFLYSLSRIIQKQTRNEMLFYYGLRTPLYSRLYPIVAAKATIITLYKK